MILRSNKNDYAMLYLYLLIDALSTIFFMSLIPILTSMLLTPDIDFGFEDYFTLWKNLIPMWLIVGLIASSSSIYAYYKIYKTSFEIEKKFAAPLRNEISKARSIICESSSCRCRFGIMYYGWMFLSEDAIEYYSVTVKNGNINNIKEKNVLILLDDIKSVKTKKANRIVIKTINENLKFCVAKPKEWKKYITSVL